LDKALYDDYLCWVASNKQQIQWYEVKETTGNSETELKSVVIISVVFGIQNAA